MCSSALRMPFKRRGSWSIDLHSIMYLSSCHHRPMHYAEELMQGWRDGHPQSPRCGQSPRFGVDGSTFPGLLVAYNGADQVPQRATHEQARWRTSSMQPPGHDTRCRGQGTGSPRVTASSQQRKDGRREGTRPTLPTFSPTSIPAYLPTHLPPTDLPAYLATYLPQWSPAS